MDASDEFKFVVVSNRACSGHRQDSASNKELCVDQNESNLRNVPICVYKENKNFKLQFFWNKAFKLFETNQRIYKAVSGIHYQDSTRGTCSRAISRHPVELAPRAKSLSHSHLNRLKEVMEQPEAQVFFASSSDCKTKRDRTQEFHAPNNERVSYNEGEGAPVPLPRKQSARKTNSCKSDNKSNTMAFNAIADPVAKQKPAAGLISGGEKPQGGRGKRIMDNECASIEGNIHLPVMPVQLRRSHSVKSHGGVHSLDEPRNFYENYKFPRNPPLLLEDYQKPFSPKSVKSFLSSTDDPQYANLVGSDCFGDSPVIPSHQGEGGCCDCVCDLSNFDSGLDTWNGRSLSPCAGMKSNSQKSFPEPSRIVCTISQKIPSKANKCNGLIVAEDASSLNSNSYDDSLERRGEMNAFRSSSMNTTVVLINGCSETEHFQFDNLTECDYDYECMSEVDLNSESGSGSGMISHRTREKKKKIEVDVNKSLTRNEFDSLDLTLFEDSFKTSGCGTMAEIEELNDNEPLYDTVCSEDNKSEVPHTQVGNSQRNIIHVNAWSDAGNEFEFMAANSNNRDIPMGHTSRGNPPEVDWEPYFCVLNQFDQMFTAYRSEEMSIFPGTPTRPRTSNNLADRGISDNEVPRVRLDGGPNSIKCLINNAKWGMNTLLEEEEDGTLLRGNAGETGKPGDSSTTSSSIHRNSSPLDTSYNKACNSSEQRRSSAPLTPLLGRESSSRFANFFSKRSFKSNPLKRTKSVTKLERKKPPGSEQDGGLPHPSRLRTSRSHESLLAWTNHSVSNLVNNGMMSTMDLGSGNVTIRPLHTSILSQDFAFQVSTPAGSKYYLCSSVAERDAWVYALRKAIKPHADEIRRHDNSLKIWVLEAKGISGGGKSSSKKYFCELYLDDCLYARTCAKTKGEMLFWGEHFEFTQLPNCVQMITVVFFKEDDKKKKKKNVCLGRVKIPTSSVNSRSLIEKWYPVVPDTAPQSGKEKECPSMRIKCKYQSVDILPVRCYMPFLQYIKNEYGLVCEYLEGTLSVKAKEDLATALVHVLHHEGHAKEFISELALQEILKNGLIGFRHNTIFSKSVEAFLKLTGTEYLHTSLGPFIEHFQRSEDVCDCEIDPMKLSPGANLAKNQQNLRMAVDTCWKSILHSHSMFPTELRECFAYCREALRTAGKEELSDHLISASIFLRFLCPAILSPSLFNITNEYPAEKSARNLTLVAKVLQTLANFTRFQGKESYIEFMNHFIDKETGSMKAFLSCISSPVVSDGKRRNDKIPPGGFIDLGKYCSLMSTLLTENVGKIASKNDRFKTLQEILETIHAWLKQPPNASYLTSFPFPHVTSAPPTQPPPPAPMGVPVNHSRGHPASQFNQSNSNNQYHTPLQSGTPIYAVSSVIHNNANPKVKNITQVSGKTWNDSSSHKLPLHLQIPNSNQTSVLINNNNRAVSQASSGYHSQSPVLEGEDKSKKYVAAKESNLAQTSTPLRSYPVPYDRIPADQGVPLNFSNPVFGSRKAGSQSVDNLSAVGDGLLNGDIHKQRLARSSSSSDYEYSPLPASSSKPKPQAGSYKEAIYGNLPTPMQGKTPVKSNLHRMGRRPSAELLRRSHPYSSSTDEESDSQRCEETTPQLPPRRGQLKRSSGIRPSPMVGLERQHDNVRRSASECIQGINCSEYEREMVELRHAMEALQSKLSRAEERLFGEGQNQNQQSCNGERSSISPGRNVSTSFGDGERAFVGTNESPREMDQLLQRLLSAEEEIKREQELLVALDRKQKLIEAQEEKIARLDGVNNQLLEALTQIRDTLQQQQMQQQQQKIQQELLYQQQHLRNLSNSVMHDAYGLPKRSSNGNNAAYDGLRFPYSSRAYSDSSSVQRSSSIGNINNTTRVLIKNEPTGDSGRCNNNDNRNDPNRNSGTYVGEQALKILADLKSSSC